MRIPVNGVKWNVTVTGSGSPLLLLHGFTGAGSNWEPFVPSWRDAFGLDRRHHWPRLVRQS